MRSRWALACLVLVAAAGCRPGTLSERWLAEKAAWHAQRRVDRLAIDPRLASERDVAQALAAHRSIAQRWPAAVWVPRAIAGDTLARDVARIAGRALVTVALQFFE
ncbi:MAG: hypothetical protein HOP12_06285, partial [Candidatus Eisenbacteria bacterium]|nr:hypothetical protein [Candidatus Eisenbacteria bacterium]